MKIRSLALVVALVASTSANAVPLLVAGWDFSQLSPGSFSIDGGDTDTNTLSAVASQLDIDNPALGTTAVASPGLGLGAAVYGTLYLNGQFGSFNAPTDYSTPVVGSTPTLTLNGGSQLPAAPLSSIPFGTQLVTEPGSTQFSAQEVALVARNNSAPGGILNIVFGADLSSASQLRASGLELSFAGRTLGGISNVAVEFSTDGTTYNPIGTASLNGTESVFSFSPVGTDLTQAFYRLKVQGSSPIEPRIDNVRITADVTAIPEPGTALLMMAGLVGLATLGHKHA